MKLKFGLDLGTNSIGLAIINEAENSNEKSEIKLLTSRILPDDEDIRKMTENFLKGQSMSKDSKGKAISKNAKRREARGARRMNQRYLQRKKKLIVFLKELSFLPQEFPINTDTSEIDKYFTQVEETEKKALAITFIVENAKQNKANIGLFNYYLREEALNRELKREELARIFYQLNQKRGFKSNRKDRDSNDDDETTKKVKKEPLQGIVKSVTLLRTCEPTKKQIVYKEYEIEMIDGKKGLSYQLENRPCKFTEGAEVLFDLNFKKDKITKKEHSEIKWRERSAWESEMLEINEAIKNSDKSVGQYFFNQLIKNPFYRIKDKKILREFYIEEFDAICNFQKQFHPELTEANIAKLRNEIIYFQRHWGQANDLDECRFEYKEVNGKRFYNKVCPRSNPNFQEFRTWQQIQNTKIFNKYEKEISLTIADKEWLYKKLDSTKTIKDDSLLAAFQKRNKEIVRISWKKAIAGNETKIDLNSLFEDYLKNHITDEAEKENFKRRYTPLLKDPTKLYLLWQMCYSIGVFTKEEKLNLINALTSSKAERNFGVKFSKELAVSFANSNNLKYERKHSNLSSLAAKKLLPFMKCGEYFTSDEIIDTKTKERIEKIITGEFDEDISDTVALPLLKPSLILRQFKKRFLNVKFKLL